MAFFQIMIPRILIFIAFIQVLLACHSNSGTVVTSSADYWKTDTVVQDRNTSDSLLIHFWENFDLSDITLATSADYGEQHFVDFINLFPYASEENINLAISNFIFNTSINNDVQKYYTELSERYLYHVNSPFYSEKYYILFLENYLQSKNISSDSKERYKILLQLAKKNQVGEIATDFRYFADGKFNQLHELKSEYTILFFYEPGCPYCESARDILVTNSEFSHKLNKQVVLLAIYPDGEKNIWEQYSKNIPQNWINGIDLDKEILKNSLYDLKASPTIYLLDQNKKVLLKDADLQQLLEYLNQLGI